MTEHSGKSTVVVDLDGVVWLAGEALPGSSDAITMLRSAGYQILFATNNSSPTISQLMERLTNIKIDAQAEEIVTSAQAAASLIPRHSSAYILGEAGVNEAVAERGITVDGDPEAVIVGWNREFSFDIIARAARSIRSGASFIATNEDPTHPTPDGLLPGTGALVSAIATASECSPVVAGKPGLAMAELVHQRSTHVSLMIGDRPSTDGQFAQVLGAPFALVHSEATPAGSDPPAYEGTSLLSVVRHFLNGSL